ncbi:MAG: AbrB family transcriptional regulator [Amaricoccus sp.]
MTVARWAALAAVSAVLVLLLERARLPAALLLGPMAAGIGFSLAGAGLEVPRTAFQLAQALVGLMIARILTLPVLQEILAHWPLFAVGVLSVTVASAALGWTLARLGVLPGTTAVWGSSPGAASAMTLLSTSFGADMRLVAFMQYTRVVIVASLAAVLARIWADPAPAAAGAAWLSAPAWGWLGATLALAALAVLVGRHIPMPAPALLLPLIVGTLLQDAELLEIELPQPLLAAAYAAIGWGIGLRFDRPTVRHAARALPAVTASIACLVALCGGFAALLVVFADLDPLTAYLAMSPGGADTVAIIASSTPVDVAFVMAMQTARLLFVLMTGPAVARFVASRVPPPAR